MNPSVKHITNFLKESRGLDFSGIPGSMLERRIITRLSPTASGSVKDYFKYLGTHPGELDSLIGALTIGVSWFFRDPLAFEFLVRILKEEIRNKIEKGERDIRIWSPGCSTGEEPYSLALIINDILRGEEVGFNPYIFATDIDRKALQAAQKGCYGNEAVKNIKQGQFAEYFSSDNGKHVLDPAIAALVSFSFYDLLDNKRSSPPDSVFGDFDLILCRNVLIYYEEDYQKKIFSKLYRSLRKGGYLVLGEAEAPVKGYREYFKREHVYAKIYQKSHENIFI